MSRKAPDNFIPGAVISDAMYTALELSLRLGWSLDDMSLALSTGLKRHVFGDTVYIFGSDVMDFIRSQPAGGDA